MDKCYSTSGTHGYIAPEVYASPHLHGRTADWFAAGVTLHELLTGRRPFEAHRLSAFRNNLHSDTLDTAFLRSKSALSLECRDFTSRCLDRFPQVRMGAANGFAEIQAHPWFLALDWDGIVHQTVAAPLQPKRVFNRELKCEEVQRAIHAHLNAPSISDADNLKFEQFGYQSEICDSPRQSCDLE
jgi:serine/threonine protein kinase